MTSKKKLQPFIYLSLGALDTYAQTLFFFYINPDSLEIEKSDDCKIKGPLLPFERIRAVRWTLLISTQTIKATQTVCRVWYKHAVYVRYAAYSTSRIFVS